MSSPRPNKAALQALARASWDAVGDERPRFFLFVFLFVLANVLDLASPWAFGLTVGYLAKYGLNDETFRTASLGIAAFAGLQLLGVLAHHFARYFQVTCAYSARMNSLNRIFGAFMRFPLTWHVKTHSGENLSKLHRSAGAVDTTIHTYTWQVVEGMVKIAFASVTIFALDFGVAVNVIVISLVAIYMMIFFNKKLMQAIRNNNSFANKVSRICVDYLYHIVTVKTLGLERAATQYLGAQKAEGYGYSKRIARFSELKWGSTAVGFRVVTGVSLVLYLYTHRNGGSTPFEVAQLLVLRDYLDKIFQAIGSFTAYYGGIIESSIAYEDGKQVIEEADEIEKERIAADVAVDRAWSVLRIRDLTFAYDSDKPGLADLSIDIRRGDKIALVGPSGGGKSTFLKIVGGLLTPERYSLETDRQSGLPIAAVTQLSLLVPQEPEIFSETLYYNLTMGEAFDQERIPELVSLCRLDGVLGKLPEGIHTYLAENGMNLSVGEKQRVAMARGLLRAGGRDILLLDEPTSSLDPRTEKEIFLGLLSHFSDRTIVTACHRLNLVPLFDTIIYVSGGKVREVGSFQELVDRQGLFFSAWEDYQKRVAPAS